MKYLWIFLLTFALLIRILTAFAWEEYFGLSSRSISHQTTTNEGQAFFFGDSDSYWTLGRALAFDRPYEHGKENWTIFRMPGYPALLAPIFWLGGENPPVIWARIENAFFGMLTVALVGCLAFLLFENQKIAWLAALFAAIEPCSVVESILVLAEEPFVVAMLLQLICFVFVFCKTNDKKSFYSYSSILSMTFWTFALGMTSALTVYFRPDWFYFLPFCFVFWAFYLLMTRFFFPEIVMAKISNRELKGDKLKKTDLSSFSDQNKKVDFDQNKQVESNQNERVEFCERTNDREKLPFLLRCCFVKMISVFIGSMFVFWAILMPWGLRNERLTGRFIPTTLQMGASLYDGLNPQADGSSNMDFVESFRIKEQISPSGDSSEHFEVRLDRRFKKASLEWIRENPQKVLSLAFVKFVRLWNVIPNEPAFSSTSVRIILVMTYLPLLILGILGAWMTFRPHLRSADFSDNEADNFFEKFSENSLEKPLENLSKKSLKNFADGSTEMSSHRLKQEAGKTFPGQKYQQKYQGGFVFWLLWLPAIYITLLHIIFVSSIRYRTPAMFGLMILASATIIYGIDWFSNSKNKDLSK